MGMSLLYRTNEWLLVAMFFLAMFGSILIGNKLGRRRQPHVTEASRGYAAGILAGSIGLLGLILGFSFSMALGRYDATKSQIVSEANAVGTAFLRSQTLSPEDAKISRELFARYADSLNAYYGSATNWAAIEAATQNLDQLRGQLWNQLIAVSRKNPNMVPTGLYMQSLNEMIDQGSLRLHLMQFRVPETLYALLSIISLLTLGLAGYVAGLASMKRSLSNTILAIMVSLVILVIIDLERPKRGLIQVDGTRLDELQKTIKDFAELP